MQVKIGITFNHAEITYFKISKLYAYVKQIRQADFMERNTILIKVYQKLRNSTEILLVLFLMYVIFLITPVLLLLKLGI